ncbi:NAD(P)-dependent oxidoreductase [Candidatus Pacearchaeota archaeon]|nr:NAD(P)-dependent oxidoreductase [Candidatus Pacearchaeota archaeon]
MKKILLTGGTGYVGSLLTTKLLDEGYKVKVLDNLMYNQTNHLPHLINKNFEFVWGDIRDKSTVKKVIKDADIILHLAAIVGVPACNRDPKLAEQTNIIGARNINLLRNKKQPLIYASTGSNYGKLDEICTEKSPLNPVSLYGKTKSQAEKEIMEKGNSVALRFATGFGVSPRFRFDSLLINDFVYQAHKNKYLVLYERKAKRTFIHVKDMVDSYIFTLDNLDKMLNEIYNVGSEKMNFTKEEIAVKIKEKMKNINLFFGEIGEDEDKRDYEVSYEKIRKVGFETKISLEDGIEELVKAFQNLPFKESQTINTM